MSRAAHRLGRPAARAVAAIALPLLLTVSCGRVGDETRETTPTPVAQPDTVTVVEAGAAAPPMPFVTDDAIVGLPDGREVPLGAEASPALTGSLSPLAVPSPEGGSVAYNAWVEIVPLEPGMSASDAGVRPGDPVGVPLVRVLDLATGEDAVLVDGGYSVAWRADGAIAYVEGVEREFRPGHRYVGHVMVRPSPDARPEAWTREPDRYVVYGWAGDVLLLHRVGEVETLDALALDGPGRLRPLAEDAVIVAIAPDGSGVLIYERAGTLRNLDVATGKELASLDLQAAADPGWPAIVDLTYAGSWVGTTVAAEASLASDDARSGILVLDVRPGAIVPKQLLPFDGEAFPMGIDEPRLLGEAASQVVAGADLPGKGGEAKGVVYVYLHCDLVTVRCTQGPEITDRVFLALYNPSRPLPEATLGGEG